MAGFKAHLTGGVIAGAGFSAFGFHAKFLNPFQIVAVIIAGAFAGLLPDLDSDTGKPLSFIFHFISVLIPSLLFPHAAGIWGKSPEFVISWFSLSYILIRYVACAMIKKITIHRGIMHSVPFAALAAGVGHILFAPSGKYMALLCAATIFSGCMVHLLMDEFNSFSLKFGFIPVLKRSIGTALKLKSDSPGATLLIYLLLVAVYAIVILYYW